MSPNLRALHIDLIVDKPSPVVDTFRKIWDSLSIVELNVQHTNGGEFIYYDKSNKVIFYRDDKNNIFDCYYDNCWEIYITLNKEDLSFDDVQCIMKILLENTLNRTIPIPRGIYYTLTRKIELALLNHINITIE